MKIKRNDITEKNKAILESRTIVSKTRKNRMKKNTWIIKKSKKKAKSSKENQIKNNGEPTYRIRKKSEQK